MTNAEEAAAHDKVREILKRFLIERGQPLYSFSTAAFDVIETLKTLGWLPPDQLAIRDAETTRRALELAAEKCGEMNVGEANNYGATRGAQNYIRAKNAIQSLQPAPTGWKLVPEELPAENNKKAVKLALSATVGNWPDYMNSLYRVMIGRVK